MIELGLSDDYLKGFNDRLKSVPFDNKQSEDWQMGWRNADQQTKSTANFKPLQEYLDSIPEPKWWQFKTRLVIWHSNLIDDITIWKWNKKTKSEQLLDNEK